MPKSIVVIEPDPFAENFSAEAGSTSLKPNPGFTRASQLGRFSQVRRPVRGLVLKENTYAAIQVRTADGRTLPLIDAAGTAAEQNGYTTSNSNFLLQQVNESRAEKVQVVQTFGEPYIFFYGEQPRVIMATGVLMNTLDFNWMAEFWENYEKYLRGTRCVQAKTRVYLSWDDVVTEGYMMSAEASQDAENRNWVRFSFQFFLTNYQNISNIGNGSVLDNTGNTTQDLDPTGLGTQSSGTVFVRRRNAKSLTGKSLLQNLRDGQVLTALAQGTELLTQVQDTVQNYISQLASFAFGRNIRVPVGFEGAAVYDDTQVALASIDPSSFQMSITGDRVVRIQGTIGGKQFTILGEVLKQFITPRFGSLSLNTDEFVARTPDYFAQTSPPPDIYRQQRVENARMVEQVQSVMATFGVNTSPPSEIARAAARVAFGVGSVVVGSAVSTSNASTTVAQIGGLVT